KGIKNLWCDPRRLCAGEQSFIRKGRQINWTEHRKNRVAGLSRHRKSMVEAAGARACGRNHQSIKYLAATLVGVETIANEFAKKAGALRITVADHSLLGCRIFAECCAAWPVAEIGGKVADRSQPKTGYRRAFGFVDRLIQTNIESSIHLDRASGRSKPPGLAR